MLLMGQAFCEGDWDTLMSRGELVLPLIRENTSVKTPSFLQQIFIEHLLYASCCSWNCEYSSGKNKVPTSQSVFYMLYTSVTPDSQLLPQSCWHFLLPCFGLEGSLNHLCLPNSLPLIEANATSSKHCVLLWVWYHVTSPLSFCLCLLLAFNILCS